MLTFAWRGLSVSSGGAVPGWFCPPILFPGIPVTLKLQTSLKTFKWSCRLWPHISGHIIPETEEAPGIVDVYPKVIC